MAQKHLAFLYYVKDPTKLTEPIIFNQGTIDSDNVYLLASLYYFDDNYYPPYFEISGIDQFADELKEFAPELDLNFVRLYLKGMKQEIEEQDVDFNADEYMKMFVNNFQFGKPFSTAFNNER